MGSWRAVVGPPRGNGPGRLAVLDMACRCARHKISCLPALLAGHPGNEQVAIRSAEPLRWLVRGVGAAAEAVAAAAIGLAEGLTTVADGAMAGGAAEPGAAGEATRDDNSELS